MDDGEKIGNENIRDEHIGFASIGVDENIRVENIPDENIPVENIRFDNIGIDNIGLDNIDVENIGDENIGEHYIGGACSCIIDTESICTMLTLLTTAKNETVGIDRTPHVGGVRLVSNFRDFKETMEEFRGDGLQNFDKWLDEFERIAVILSWTTLQRWFYVRQLCTGTARKFLACNMQLNQWDTLRAAMLDEFGEKVNSVHVHDALRARKKKPTENCNDYLLALIALAKTIGLDDAAIIEYAIRGIQDTKLNKIVLYGAKTLADFKQRLKTYERICVDSQE